VAAWLDPAKHEGPWTKERSAGASVDKRAGMACPFQDDLTSRVCGTRLEPLVKSKRASRGQKGAELADGKTGRFLKTQARYAQSA
jgi:hypothetical protein